VIGNSSNASSKTPAGIPSSKSSTIDVIFGQVQCLPPCSACNGERTRTRKASSSRCKGRNHTGFRFGFAKPRSIALFPTVNIVLSGTFLLSHSKTISYYMVARDMRRPTRAAEPCRSHHHHFLHPPPLPLPPRRPPRLPSQADVALNAIPDRKVKGKEVTVWHEMQVLRGLNHSNIVRPISLPSPPLPCLHFPFLMTHARMRVIVCRLTSFFSLGQILRVVRVADKVLSRFRTRRWAICGELFKHMRWCGHFLERDASRCLSTFGHFSVSVRWTSVICGILKTSGCCFFAQLRVAPREVSA
jgi:hypothetical protein